MNLKDLKFEKDKITSDFQESEELENIKSGERLSVIFGKIQRWFNDLKDLPKRYYVKDVPLGLDLHPTNDYNNATGEFSITSGERNTASGRFSSAYGFYNRSTGFCSFATGSGNQSSDAYTIAIGTQNKASGFASIAIGQDNTATSSFSLAIGKNSNAKANFSLAIGEHCIASVESQTVLGKYNIADSDNKYSFIIGNGTSTDNRSNALTLDWNGNLWLSGDITATGTDGQEISLGILNDELKQTETNVMNIVKNQNNLIQMNNTEHAQLREQLEAPVELTDSGWAPENRLNLTNADGGSVLYRKYGKLVVIRGALSLARSGEWDIATLPENCRPTSVAVSTYAVGNSPVKLEITSDGVVTVHGNNDHEYIKLHICFLTD